MKKLFFTAVIALGTFAMVQAQETKTQDPTVEIQEETEPADVTLLAKTEVQAYKEVKASELPKAIQAALTKDFTGATVQNAYMNDKTEYKLILQLKQDTKPVSKTVYVTKDGQWLKQPQAQR